ncbi:uncharacterized protein VTP21DRAFT_6882 [Calcarisporiella thermophila]|uniref:uncharacterized protein n=1 Tax=Calcarisporiella thermophila TaxID=911321 RepID=UPI003742BBEA
MVEKELGGRFCSPLDHFPLVTQSIYTETAVEVLKLFPVLTVRTEPTIAVVHKNWEHVINSFAPNVTNGIYPVTSSLVSGSRLPPLKCVPLPDDGELIGKIRSKYPHCPRIYDVVQFAEVKGLKLQCYTPWNEQVPDTWVFRFYPSTSRLETTECMHVSQGSQIIWTCVPMDSYANTSNMRVRLSDTVPIHSGFGKLVFRCLDPICPKETYIDEYGASWPYNMLPYLTPPDMLYRVVHHEGLAGAAKWLVSRLCGPDSRQPKLAYLPLLDKWVAWDGVVWRRYTEIPAELSMGCSRYVERIRAQLPVRAEEDAVTTGLIRIMDFTLMRF